MPNPSGPMACPVDGTTLVMSERSGIEIDYCPQCRGVWLDRGELDKIIERNAEAGATAPRPRPRPRPGHAPPPQQAPWGQRPTPAKANTGTSPTKGARASSRRFSTRGPKHPCDPQRGRSGRSSALLRWTRQAGQTPMKITTTLAAAIGLVGARRLRRP